MDLVTVVEISDKYRISRKAVMERIHKEGVKVEKTTLKTAKGDRVFNAISADSVDQIIKSIKAGKVKKQRKSAFSLSILWGISEEEIIQTGESLNLSPSFLKGGDYSGPHYSKWQQDRLRAVLVPEDLEKSKKYKKSRAKKKVFLSNHDLGLYSRLTENYVPKRVVYA